MVELWNDFVDFCLKIMYSVFGFFQDMLWFVLDGLFTVGQSMLALISTSLSGLSPLQYFDSIPSGTQAIMQAIGFNESIALLMISIGIRIILQMIPFVRFGS